MIIDHVGVDVSDFDRASRFYDAALGALGAVRIMEIGPAQGAPHRVTGYAASSDPERAQSGGASVWIAEAKGPITRSHIALRADSQDQVRAFHAAAIAAGGKDNGGPGERPHYHPGYYAAFALDPDGHNIEAVFHGKPNA